MSSGRQKKKIPECYLDLTLWPQVDKIALKETLSSKNFGKFESRREAIEMYVAGKTYAQIKKATKICPTEMRRHIVRCIGHDGAGNIWGFRALVPGVHLKTYERTAAIELPPEQERIGYAGALKQLFARFPGFESEMVAYFFRISTPNNPAESRVRYKDLHSEFKRRARERCITDNEYPFNSSTFGYHAIRNHCKKEWEKNPLRFASSRSGEDAAKRGDIGTGIKPLIAAMRPYTYVQLDYHKIDAACTIVFVNERGHELRVVLRRWHVAFLIEEHAKAIIGAHIVLEATPSADAALETVDSALRPQDFPDGHPARQILTDGKALIGQLLPELSYQCFSVLKVDNGWANSAMDVINNIQGTVGCAVNFGPAFVWARRKDVENAFGRFTRESMQRMPSTYGNGPSDTRKRKPDKTAMDFEISLSDIISLTYSTIAEINQKNTGANLGASPVVALRHAYNTPESGFVHQPLPKEAQENMWLMMKSETRTVRGSRKKGTRPHVNLDGDRYTNPRLANMWELIGKKLKLYIDRRDASIVYASVAQGGEQLGRLSTTGAFGQTKCSLQIRKLIKRDVASAAFTSERQDPVKVLVNKLGERISGRGKGAKNKPSTDALTMARIEMNNRNVVALEAAEAAKAAGPGDPVLASGPSPAEFNSTSAPTEPIVSGQMETTSPPQAGTQSVPVPRRPRMDVFSENVLPTLRATTRRR